jgi:hypothetical protein
LKAHLERPDEEALDCVYNLGRDAARHGLGILDMTTLHNRALLGAVAPEFPAGAQEYMNQAYAFFTESLVRRMY